MNIFYKEVYQEKDGKLYSAMVATPPHQVEYIPDVCLISNIKPGFFVFDTLENCMEFCDGEKGLQRGGWQVWRVEGEKEEDQPNLICEIGWTVDGNFKVDKDFLVPPPVGTIFLSKIKLLEKVC